MGLYYQLNNRYVVKGIKFPFSPGFENFETIPDFYAYVRDNYGLCGAGEESRLHGRGEKVVIGTALSLFVRGFNASSKLLLRELIDGGNPLSPEAEILLEQAMREGQKNIKKGYTPKEANTLVEKFLAERRIKIKI